jgi:lysophospholipid acyltransferase (LPLAT)-like uncharacterized protein
VTSRSQRKFTLGQRIVLAVVPRLVWAFLWPIGLTWRFEVIAEEGVTPVVYGEKAGPEIYCFWHQCVLPCTIYFRISRAIILISQSFDGELITRILRMFGFDAVRGSSSRGGIEGLQALRRVIESGKTAIFTADGPRGPIYQTKMGPVKLASITGAPIGAFYLAPQRAWQMKSWDQFLIPKPFTRICVSWGQWTHVALGTPTEEFEAKRQELNDSLERSRINAVEYFKNNPKGAPRK